MMLPVINRSVSEKMFPYGSIDIVIFCDGSGGTNGNDGGWAFSAQSTHGNILHEEYGPPEGHSTNNVSEYRAVINALKWSKDQTVGHITIKTDSVLVVNQVLNRWQCKKEHLKPFCQEAKQLIAQHPSISLVWIPREENTRADELSRAWEDEHVRTS